MSGLKPDPLKSKSFSAAAKEWCKERDVEQRRCDIEGVEDKKRRGARETGDG